MKRRMILVIMILDLDDYFRLRKKYFRSSRILIKIVRFLIEIKVRLDFRRLISIKDQIIVDFGAQQSN